MYSSRGVLAHAALRFNDAMQRGVHILRHAAGVAAHVDAGAALNPTPQLRTLFDHAVLHVDLAFLVAREGGVHAREVAVREHRFKFLAIEKIGGSAALSEEEPVLARRREGTPLVQECAERSDAGAGADHDDRRIGRSGQTELLVGMDVDGTAFAGVSAIGQQRGTDSAALAIVRAIAHHGDRGMDLSSMREWARRDGVETRSKLRQHRNQVGGIVQDAGIVVDKVDETAVPGVFVQLRLLFGHKQVKQRLAVAYSRVGFDHLAREPRDLEVIGEGVSEGCRAALRELHGRLGAELQRGDDFADQLMIVLRDDPARIACFVLQVRVGDREGQVHRLLAGDLASEWALVDQRRIERILARIGALAWPAGEAAAADFGAVFVSDEGGALRAGRAATMDSNCANKPCFHCANGSSRSTSQSTRS